MADNLAVELKDQIDPKIASKIQAIAAAARAADSDVAKLQGSLGRLNVDPQVKAAAAMAQLERATSAAALATSRGAAADAQAALSKAKIATEAQRTATAMANAATAQTNGMTAAQKYAKAQQDVAAATAKAADAANKAALSAAKLNAQQNKPAPVAASGRLGGIKSAAAPIAAAVSVAGVLKLADAYTTMQNKLQTVAESQGQVNLLTDRMFEIANRTRSGVAETTTAFVRFDRGMKQLGKSQEDTMQVTETIQKMLVLGGATATEAASSLLQLSQAFNSGVLAGDEFKAVAENMPSLLDALAKSMNKPVGALKELGSKGKITVAEIVKALSASKESVDKMFAKTAPTMGQGLAVLVNNLTKAIGEFDKFWGISANISRAMIWISFHLKEIGIAAAAVGGGLLVVFGPALIGAIAAVTTAVAGFSAMLLANPIILVGAAIAAAIAYLIIFRDKIMLGVDATTTIGDLFRGVWTSMKEVVSSVVDVISSAWGMMVKDATSAFNSISEWIRSIIPDWVSSIGGFFTAGETGFAGFLLTAAKVFDAIFAGVGALVSGVANAVQIIPELFSSAFKLAYNKSIGWIEDLTNAAIGGLNKARELVGKDPMEMVKFAKMDGGDVTSVVNAAVKLGESMSQGLGDGFASGMENGLATKGVKAMLANAQKARDERLKEEKASLRGAGKAGPTVAKTDKAAEKRAEALRKVNKELDDEIKRMGMLAPERERQAKFDQIEESLLSKKIKLNDGERESIKAKIKTIQEASYVQAEFDRIYEEAAGPQRTYTAGLTAADKLLKMGAISTTQYGRAVFDLNEAHKNALDPLRQYNKDYDIAMKATTLSIEDRAVEVELEKVRQLLKVTELTKEQTQAIRDKTIALTEATARQSAEDELYNNGTGARKAYIAQLQAIAKLKTSGAPNAAGDAAQAQSAFLTGMGIETQGMQVEIDARVAKYQDMYAKFEEAATKYNMSEQDRANGRAQIKQKQWDEEMSGTQSFLSGIESLSTSSNKKMAAVGKAAAIANALITTYSNANKAFNAFASIPYVGPALGAAAAAAAIAAGMANVSKIRSTNAGFRDGGYTGTGPADKVAGEVHKGEYVQTNQVVRREGVAKLQALQNGNASIQMRGQASPTAENPGNGGYRQTVVSAPTINVPVAVVNSQESAESYLASQDGEGRIIRVLENNRQTIKGIVS